VRREALVAATAAALLTGCASHPEWNRSQPQDALFGRMTVRIEPSDAANAPRNMSAAFELAGDASRGRLDLNTPIGTTLARARWEPGLVALITAQGESRYADMPALTREMLGEELPLAALFDWLRGRPWPGAPSTAALPPADAGFNQLGWDVNLAQFADAWVTARRELPPAVTVRVKLERP
jgi:outer membrane lipoprotein LolB